LIHWEQQSINIYVTRNMFLHGSYYNHITALRLESTSLASKSYDVSGLSLHRSISAIPLKVIPYAENNILTFRQMMFRMRMKLLQHYDYFTTTKLPVPVRFIVRISNFGMPIMIQILLHGVLSSILSNRPFGLASFQHFFDVTYWSLFLKVNQDKFVEFYY